MLLQEQPNEVETYNAGKTTGFRIEESAMAFTILSSSLYSNKARAVIREYSANAVDAHLVVGKAGVPIQVHLPNGMEPYFSVRDFGPGLSEKDIRNVYTVYFKSTKRKDGSQIGGFGLGSKSAFAYTDMFTVTSFFGGKKATYNCYRDSNGEPQISKMASQDSDEETGILIQVGVKHDDFEKFTDEASYVYEYYSVRPDITGDSVVWETPEIRLSGANWEMQKGHPKMVILVGPTPYSLDSSQVEFDSPYVGTYVLRMTVNEVSLTPSRESISYDATTLANLKAALANLEKDIKSMFQKEIDLKETVIEAMQFAFSIEAFSANDNFDYRGQVYSLQTLCKEASEQFDAIWEKITKNDDPEMVRNFPIKIRSVRETWSRRRPTTLSKNSVEVLNFLQNSAFTKTPQEYMLLDISTCRGFERRFKEYVTQNNLLQKGQNFHVITFGKLQGHLNEVCRLMMLDPSLIVDASTIMPAAPVGQRAPNSANAYHYVSSNKTQKVKIVDIEDEEIFYLIKDVTYSMNPAYFLNEITQIAKAIGQPIEAREVYLIPKGNLKYFDKDNLINLDEYIRDFFKNAKHDIRKYVVEQKSLNTVYRNFNDEGFGNFLKAMNVAFEGGEYRLIDIYARFTGDDATAEAEAMAQKSILETDAKLKSYPFLYNHCKTAGSRYREPFDEPTIKHYMELWDTVVAAGLDAKIKI